MAINFPDSPSTNDTHTVGDKKWIWNGTYWHLNQSTSNFSAQDSLPSNPVAGDFWFESDTGQLFVRYDSAWVEIGHATDFGSSMSDADGDTLIQLEEGSDEDIIRFDTGGTERMTIAADGTVTIAGNMTVNGTTTTINSTTLTVDDKNLELGSVATPSDTTADGGGITLKGASDKTILWTNSTDAWHFNQGINVTSGNIGIGETAPASDLVVRADSAAGRGGEITILNYATSTVGNEAALNFGLENSTYAGDAGNAQIKARLNATSGAADLIFSNWTGGAFTEHLRIMADGKVGIGTPTPAGLLDVNGAIHLEGGTDRYISYRSGTADILYSFDSGDFYLQDITNSAHAWYTGNVDRMRITSTGNVGIGTTSPSYLLHLSGTDPVLRIDETPGDDNVKLQLMQANSEGEGTELRYESGTGHTYLKSIFSGGNMYFQTAGANTRMQIHSSGKMVLSMGGDYTPAANIGVQSANGQAHPWGHIVSHGHSTVLWGTDNNGHYLGGDTKNFKFKRSCTWNAHPGSAGYVAMEIKAGATTHTSTGDADAEYGAVGFAAAGIYIDRHWMGNPGITICNSNVNNSLRASQSTFRMHGSNHNYNSYPATGNDPNGLGDFGISVVCDGTFSPTSDERRKTDIEDITGALASVNALRGRTFKFKNSNLETEEPGSIGGKLYGLIAQEALDVVPNAIWDDGEEPLENGWCRSMRMDYGALTAVLVEAIKELTTRLETLESA